MWVRSLGWEDALEEKLVTFSSILAQKSHGEKSLAGYSAKGLKESAEEQTPGGLSMKVCYTCTLTN